MSRVLNSLHRGCRESTPSIVANPRQVPNLVRFASGADIDAFATQEADVSDPLCGDEFPTEGHCLACRSIREDHLRSFLGDHDGRGIGVSGDEHRHDRRIHHAQAFDAMNAQPFVDHR